MPDSDRFLGRRLTDCVLQNHDNEELGRIEDVVVETASGRVSHLVVKISTGLMTSKRILVAYEELTAQYDRRVFLIRAQAESLAQREPISWDLGHRGKELSAPEGRGATASWDADPPHG